MKTIEQKGNFYHLLIEDFESDHRENKRISELSTAAGRFQRIEIPVSGALLVANDGCLPHIVDTPCWREDNIFVFQPFRSALLSHLLMVSPGCSRPLINAIPAPPIALLNIKDEIMFPNVSPCIAHVSVYSRPLLGPPPKKRIGQKCPICRSKLLKETLTYTCYQCGQVIHCQDDGKSKSDRFNCANIGNNCPVCRSKIDLSDGYVYLPE